ncbi:MAG: hypothetical protein OEV42_15295 [Deltaproteobacteria bacterium]|nr:hypothetical protein [Deltaproteobacteria bacterium]
MKREKRSLIIAIFAILLTMVLTACGGSSGSSGSDGGNPLAKGGFKKDIVYNDAFWVAQFGNLTSFRGHHLYRAGDIKGSGNVSALRFQYDSDLVTGVTCDNTTLKLGHTNVTDLTTTYADAIETGQGSLVTVVDNATITIPAGATDAFFEIPLTSAFNYNGVDNLLLEISRTSACSGTVYLDTGLGVGYTASVHESSATAATGATSTANITISFKFSGGDNEQTFGDVLSIESPFSQSSLLTNKVQALYKADEIDGSGPVTGVAFQMNATSFQNDVTYTLKLGHTTLTELSTAFADNFNSGAPVTVANAVDFTIPAGLQAGEYFWVPVPDGIFTYNGNDNLVVEVNTFTATTNTILRFTFTTAGRMALGSIGNDVAFDVYSATHHIKLRFNGAPVQIMPMGGHSYRQVLGGVTGTGDGQIQSLYTPSLIGTGGTVTGISVMLGADSVAATIPDYKIYMGATAKTTFNVADIYSSNMELSSTLVFNGTFDIPAGLKTGDWIRIPLQTAFTHDPTKNMSILFMADSASPGNNRVSASSNAARFPNHSVWRDDNTVDITGMPEFSYNGIVDVQLNISK